MAQFMMKQNTAHADAAMCAPAACSARMEAASASENLSMDTAMCAVSFFVDTGSGSSSAPYRPDQPAGAGNYDQRSDDYWPAYGTSREDAKKRIRADFETA